MVFSSPEFLFMFLPLALLLYFLTPNKFRNITLLVVSLIFYGWAEPKLVILMVSTIIVDYVLGFLIGTSKEKEKPKLAKLWLIIAIVLNIGTLAFFKYTNFVIENLNNIFNLEIVALDISLPIGISFYTFQALSYVIDVYRCDCNYQKSIVKFGTYVSLYPQLIAGPIVRYSDIDLQLSSREHSFEKIASGIRTFTCGFAKKVFLANVAGALWDKFGASNTVLGSWFGILFFMFQIYFDFSGYSDMAIGLGKVMGFSFRENFYYPYASTSITDFWRRWHISLGTWFREYVYIPLGGNRKGAFRTYINILVVWFLTGLWHGASWNFVLWGLYYAFFLILEKALLSKVLDKIPQIFSRIYTLIVVFFGWWLFAFDSINDACWYLARMFGSVSFTNGTVNYDLLRNIPFLVILIIACTPYPKKLFHKLYENSKVFRYVFPVILVVVLIVAISYMISSSYNPFLYFRF